MKPSQQASCLYTLSTGSGYTQVAPFNQRQGRRTGIHQWRSFEKASIWNLG